MILTDWAKNRFAKDLYATRQTGVTIELADIETETGRPVGHAICSVVLRPEHRNAAGAVMGGVFFTLADLSTAVAMNMVECANAATIEESMKLHWVTVNSSITFIGQPRGEVISAEAICRHMGETSCLYQVDIKDGDYLVAEVMVSGHRLD
ncbi:MAG: PaaI family thioesterase [Bacteroidales bacterium]|nr:PaaI family thioesterase [Bacteroidales bacterium]